MAPPTVLYIHLPWLLCLAWSSAGWQGVSVLWRSPASSWWSPGCRQLDHWTHHAEANVWSSPPHCIQTWPPWCMDQPCWRGMKENSMYMWLHTQHLNTAHTLRNTHSLKHTHTAQHTLLSQIIQLAPVPLETRQEETPAHSSCSPWLVSRGTQWFSGRAGSRYDQHIWQRQTHNRLKCAQQSHYKDRKVQATSNPKPNLMY